MTVYRKHSKQFNTESTNGTVNSLAAPQAKGVDRPVVYSSPLGSSSKASRKKGGEAALGTIGDRVSTQATGRSTDVPNSTRSPKQYRKKSVKQERTPDEQAQARIRPYKLQDLAADILPEEKGLNACMRCRVAVATHVELVYTEGPDGGNGRADFSHLQTCGSIWLCAPCAGHNAEKRRKILARMNEGYLADGGSIWMTTYTISHHLYDRLDPLLDNFLSARKKMREGRQGMALRQDFSIEGTISVLEMTWSEENGYHPHVHELVYCRHKDFDADGYEKRVRKVWLEAAASYGLRMDKHGFDLARTFGAVQDYVTKMGHAPVSDRVWGVESEMVKGHLKRGRIGKHFSPFAILEEILEVMEAIEDIRGELSAIPDVARCMELEEALRDLMSWQVKLRGVYREYAECFKGRKQLNPSKGIQPRWKQAMEEIEREEDQKKANSQVEKQVMVEFYDDQWKGVVRERIRGELREEGDTGRPGWVLEYLEANGIKIFEEQYKRFEGWDVCTPSGYGKILSVCQQEIEGFVRWRCSVLLEGNIWHACDFVEITLNRGVSSATHHLDACEYESELDGVIDDRGGKSEVERTKLKNGPADHFKRRSSERGKV